MTPRPHQTDPSPGELRDAEAWPALIGGISDREAQVRQAALLAVGKIGDAELAPYVIMRLRDPSEQVQAAAASALHHMQSAASLAALASCLLGAADAWPRHVPAGALCCEPGPPHAGWLLLGASGLHRSKSELWRPPSLTTAPQTPSWLL